MDMFRYFRDLGYLPSKDFFDSRTGNMKFNAVLDKIQPEDAQKDMMNDSIDSFNKKFNNNIIREKYNDIKKFMRLKSRPEILSKETALEMKRIADQEKFNNTFQDQAKKKLISYLGNHPGAFETIFGKVADIQHDYKEKGLENTYLRHMGKGALQGAGLGLAGLTGFDLLELPFEDDPSIPLLGDSPYTIAATAGIGALKGAGLNALMVKNILDNKGSVPDFYKDEITTQNKKDYEDIKNTADYNYQNNIYEPEKRKQSKLEKKLHSINLEKESDESEKKVKEETTLSDLISKRYHKLLENQI